MIDEKDIENLNKETTEIVENENVEEVDVRENPVLDLSELSNDDLMEFYSKLDEQIKYLKNNIIVEEEENNEWSTISIWIR